MSVREARDNNLAMREEIYKYAVAAAPTIKYTPSSFTAPPEAIAQATAAYANRSLGQLVAAQSHSAGVIAYRAGPPSPPKPYVPVEYNPQLHWTPNASHIYNF